MEKTFKKLSWLLIVSVGILAIGALFGYLGTAAVYKSYPEEMKNFRFVLYGLITLGLIVSLISSIIAFFGARQGHVKTALISIGRNSLVQFAGPIVAYALAMVGLCNQAEPKKGLATFLTVTFVIAFFTSCLIVKALKGYRKDKENYSYTIIVSYIASGALFVFLIAAMIGELQLPASETHYNGLFTTFSILFILSDILAYVTLAILAQKVKKYAPVTSMADADAKILDDIASSIQNLNDKNKQEPVNNIDSAAEIRKFKELYDDGIITLEEFEQKKKQLLK